MDRVAIYCRLSKEDADKQKKGDDSESIQNQKKLLLDYAREHNMLVYKIYSDDDYSGTDKDRPEWNKMLRDAEQGAFNIILCKTQSRFTRELEMVEKYIHGLFPVWGIRFISIVDQVDTNMEGNKKARQINGLINEWYLEDISNNIKAVFRKKMEDGQFLGAFTPYGYKNDPEDRHKIIIDETAAKIVRQIYTLYLEGYSIKGICYLLTELQIPTPTAYKQSLGYSYQNPNTKAATTRLGVWAPTTVRSILTNSTYIGVLTQGKDKKLSYKSKKVIRAPEREWVVKENNHEAIIDRNTFDQVQKLLASKRTVSGDANGNKKRKAHCLAGKVKCLDCGSSLIKSGGGSSQESRYLRCQLANKTRNKLCTPHSIRFNLLKHIIAEEIRRIIYSILNEENARYLEDKINASSDYQNTIEEKGRELNRIKRVIQDNKEALSSLYLDKVKKVVTEAEYMILKEKFSDTIQEQQAKYSELKDEIEERKVLHEEKTDARTLVMKYVDCEELTSDLVVNFIDHIEVGEKDMQDNQDIHIYWNI